MRNFRNKIKSSKPKTKRISNPYPKSTDSNGIDNKNTNLKTINSESVGSKVKTLKPDNKLSTNSISVNTVVDNNNISSNKDKQSLKSISKLRVQLSKRINFYLLTMIFLYVIIEIVFNYMLVSQMSYSATALDVKGIERTGKVITGIGIALLMCKSLLNHANLKFKYFLKWFAGFLALGICISFILQTAIVNYVVKNATPEAQQRALLVSAANTTLVPFYDDKSETNHINMSERLLLPFFNAINSQSNSHPIQTKYQRVDNFHKTSNICSPIATDIYAKHYPINNSLNKAFFSYSHLIATETYEELHKKAIVSYFSCLFDDNVLVGMYADNLQVIEEKVKGFYQEYLEKSEKYNAKINKHPRYKDRISKKWQSGTADILGFESTLPPNLSYEDFVRHSDVKTYITNKQSIKMPYPYAEDMASEFKNSLPDFILVNYLIAKKEGIAEDKSNLDNKNESASTNDKDVSKFSIMTDYFKEPSLTVGKKSYKAVMMPMIALGFSVLFLVLNVISMLSLILSDNSKRISTWFQRIATGMFFILPFILSPTTTLTIPPNNSMILTVIIKFLYFYQSIVFTIQQAVIVNPL